MAWVWRTITGNGIISITLWILKWSCMLDWQHFCCGCDKGIDLEQGLVLCIICFISTSITHWQLEMLYNKMRKVILSALRVKLAGKCIDSGIASFPLVNNCSVHSFPSGVIKMETSRNLGCADLLWLIFILGFMLGHSNWRECDNILYMDN